MLIRRIYAVYIQPLAEYCSVVWNQGRITLNGPLSLAHKKVTRVALNVFYGMDPQKYIGYEQRCEILNQDGPSIRRNTQAAMLCVKVLKREIVLSFSAIMISHIRDNRNARIKHLLMRTAMMLAAAGNYENEIDLTLTTHTISKKIKERNSSRRTELSNSRLRGR